MKQLKGGKTNAKAKGGRSSKHNAKGKKPTTIPAVPTIKESEEKVEQALEASEASEEELNELRLKELQYIALLSKETRAQRALIDQRISAFLQRHGLPAALGNERQRQLREMSWTYLSLNKESKGVSILPCASSKSEVYQMTHLINAFRLTLEEESPQLQINGELVAVYPLAERGKDEIECLEAKRELYHQLISLSPESKGAMKRSEQVTNQQIYDLLLKVKEMVNGLTEDGIRGSKEEEG